MRAPEKATLVLRVRLTNGKRTYLPVATTANGRARAHYGMLDGEAKYFPDSVYYLKTTVAGKRVIQRMGTDTALATTLKIQQEHTLKLNAQRLRILEGINMQAQFGGLGVVKLVPDKPVAAAPAPQKRTLLVTAIAEYRRKIEVRRSYRSARSYEQHLEAFAATYTKKTVEEIRREDVAVYIEAMRREGKSPKTIANRLITLRRFLVLYGGDPSVIVKEDAPKVGRKLVKVFTRDTLKRILAASSFEERLVWETFIASGFREREVSTLCWEDVNIEDCTLQIHAKPEFNFFIKNRSEREVPIPPALMAKLAARKANPPHPRLVFPNRDGRPHGHLLRQLKTLAFECGANCGNCVNKKGKSCADGPVCSKVQLHSLRRTAATNWIEAGVPIQIVSSYLDHADLETTARYLGVMERKSDANRARLEAAFSQFSA
jgi:integrase/recombinase XerD